MVFLLPICAAGNLSIAQTIVMACRIHAIYNALSYDFSSDNGPWYMPYVKYAIKNGIIPGEYENYNNPISRAGFAKILCHALPVTALASINYVEDDAIPDIPPNATYYDEAYTLYRAGVLTGNDAKGTFTPFSNITRGAAAAIISRMVDPSLRKHIRLECSFVPESIRIEGSRTFYTNEGGFLKAYITPERATEAAAVTWKSSNRAVATIDSAGYVYGVAPGKATITATTSNGLTASYEVEILKAQSVIFAVTDVSLNFVEGVDLEITFGNASGKVINYINFYVQVYDLNWKPLKCNITGYSEKNCYTVGPYQPGDVYTASWDAIIYNGRAAYAKVNKIVVEYANGTTETIRNPAEII